MIWPQMGLPIKTAVRKIYKKKSFNLFIFEIAMNPLNIILINLKEPYNLRNIFFVCLIQEYILKLSYYCANSVEGRWRSLKPWAHPGLDTSLR